MITDPVIAQSPRDDMESLGYMLVYFICGRLPWQGIKSSRREKKDELILERKRTVSTAELCRELPSEFATFMNYARDLPDGDSPDYRWLRKIFSRLFRRNKYEYDHVYDWTILKYVE